MRVPKLALLLTSTLLQHVPSSRAQVAAFGSGDLSGAAGYYPDPYH